MRWNAVSGVDCSIGFGKLRCWLIGRKLKGAHNLCWGLIFALAHVIDRAEPLRVSSDDPFDTPDLVGPRGRLLKIAHAKNHKVAKMAASGELFKGGAAVMKGLRRFGKLSSGSNDRGVNKWVGPLTVMPRSRCQSIPLRGMQLACRGWTSLPPRSSLPFCLKAIGSMVPSSSTFVPGDSLMISTLDDVAVVGVFCIVHLYRVLRNVKVYAFDSNT